MTDPDTSWAAPEGSQQPLPPAPVPAPAPATGPAPAPVDAPPAASAQAPVPVAAPTKRSGGLVNAVLVVAALIAVGGVAFAVGRSTAPASSGRGGFANGNFAGGPNGSFTPGQGGFGGFGGFGDRTMTISGTVKSIDGTTMVITTASGNETTVDISGTTYHSQGTATASDVKVGTSVAVETQGFGGGRPDASGAPAAPVASSAPANGAPANGQGGQGFSRTVTAKDVTITAGQ